VRSDAIAYLHTRLKAATPSTADFVDAATPVVLAEQLKSKRPWVKLYMPSEEGEADVVESYLVTIDCGAIHLETARALGETIRSALASNRRAPQPFHRLRITALGEGNFHRVQLSYRVRRPEL
jgi:hypothetical protein